MCATCDVNRAHAAAFPNALPPIEMWWRWSFRKVTAVRSNLLKKGNQP
jgi:hypothetical protein